LVRFVSNGNVIVLSGAIHEGATNLDALASEDDFKVGSSTCDGVKAVIVRQARVQGSLHLQQGDVYLAGNVTESQSSLTIPSGTTSSLVVKDSNGDSISMIDGTGNLVAKGDVIAQGVPYILNRDHGILPEAMGGDYYDFNS
jgi:hypothetical protein